MWPDSCGNEDRIGCHAVLVWNFDYCGPLNSCQLACFARILKSVGTFSRQVDMLIADVMLRNMWYFMLLKYVDVAV